VVDVVEHLVGLQAQEPHDPYLALWSRLERFDPEVLSSALAGRVVVRTILMRATIHLVSGRDCLAIRPLVQPVMDAELARHPEFGPHLRGVDLAPVLAVAAVLLAEGPRTGTQLRAALAERFPDLHAPALAYACRNRLTLVQVPPRGLWGRGGAVRTTTAAHWLGIDPVPTTTIEALVLRYLGAFGPASVADVAAWSRLTALGEVVERLRPQLRTFRDERGRELFDLPDAPRPDPDTPAPVRFLPQYDNVLLSHADRSRFVDPAIRGVLGGAPQVLGAVLHDGRGAATWRLRSDPGGGPATMLVDHLPGLRAGAKRAILAEGRRVQRFRAGVGPVGDVELVPTA